MILDAEAGMGNLQPAWLYDMARIRIFVRVQNRVKTKFHDKRILK